MNAPTPLELGTMLFRLQFPRQRLEDQPESVQVAYRMDAIRLLKMMNADPLEVSHG